MFLNDPDLNRLKSCKGYMYKDITSIKLGLISSVKCVNIGNSPEIFNGYEIVTDQLVTVSIKIANWQTGFMTSLQDYHKAKSASPIGKLAAPTLLHISVADKENFFTVVDAEQGTTVLLRSKFGFVLNHCRHRNLKM